MVGRSDTQSLKGAAMTHQQGGDLYYVEYLEGRKQKDFPRHGYGCSTNGPQSQGGHRYAL